MGVPLSLWLIFGGIVTTVLVIDLGFLHKKAHAVSFKEAGFWSLLWFTLALAFSLVVWRMQGQEKALQFLAGYLLEESLSVDNMFVFVMIFHYFGIPPSHQSRVLHWGILGAIVLRFFFIFIGVSLIETFAWMIYVFGALLLFTGVKMLFQGDEAPDMASNPALKLLKRFLPLHEKQEGQAFFTRHEGKPHATPLFAALLVVEFSDVIFALDSIPAVIAITPDTFIVYTSNIFAIMGLRALYFLLSGLAGMFRYLKTGISAILCFVGLKMLAAGYYHVPIGVSLGIIASILAASIAASVIGRKAP
ncbi:MAG: TerC family protein [Elusimicrobiota bacterium]